MFQMDAEQLYARIIDALGTKIDTLEEKIHKDWEPGDKDVHKDWEPGDIDCYED